jgi:cytochrome c553
MMRILILLVSTLLLFSCKEGHKDNQVGDSNTGEPAMDPSLMAGRKIVENECYICHNPEASETSMIAPPMVAVKSHYLQRKTTREEFTKDILNWLNDPQPEKVKMRGAFRKFGIMPYQPYSEEDISHIAAFLYETELPQPEWYEEHRRQRHGMGTGQGQQMQESQEDDETPYFPMASYYREKGGEIAAMAQGVLGKNLNRALQEQGAEGAISFCKVRASGLTDSVGIMNNVIVKRVSDRARNPENLASTEESGYIIAFSRQIENQAENQGQIWPILKEMKDDEVYYYAPITTNAMCLQCHGNPEKDLQEPVLSTLQKLYPQDQALGYEAGQVRGMWKIQFVKEAE